MPLDQFHRLSGEAIAAGLRRISLEADMRGARECSTPSSTFGMNMDQSPTTPDASAPAESPKRQPTPEDFWGALRAAPDFQSQQMQAMRSLPRIVPVALLTKPRNLNSSALSDFQQAARLCSQEMRANASYIEENIRTMEVSAEHRAAILTLCSALDWTEHDVRSELDELLELGSAAPPEIIQGRIKRIVRWLSEDLPAIHEIVQALHVANSQDPKNGLAYLLVAESATNILHAFNGARDSAQAYLTPEWTLDAERSH